MKNKVFFLIFCFFVLLIKPSATTYGYVACFENTTPLTLRDSAGGNKIGTVPCNARLEIINTNGGTASNCLFYQIKYNNTVGYVCSNYLYNVKEETEENTNQENSNNNNESNSENNTNNNLPTVNRSLNGLKATPLCVENEGAINVRKTVSGSKAASLGCNDVFTIIDDKAGSNADCYDWYKISYNNGTIGYTCGKYVNPILANTLSVAETEAYKTRLRNLKFPESYLDYLVLLHAKYPNWEFEPSFTNLDFNEVINNELGGQSLIYYTYGEDYRSKEEESYNYLTDTYYRHPTEKNWWYASKEAISYFLDPRIYLNENYIYIFEKLNYDPLFHTEDAVVNIFQNTFLPRADANYANHIMGASTRYNVSPIHLSTRILQEQGVNGSIASSGGTFTYNNVAYSGYYNLFNIGAYSSNPNVSPAVMGLVKAMGGVNGTDTTYGKPWNSIEKSIYGGAEFLASSYISKGQGTLYYQKWDISPTSQTRYTHQYMANIMAPVTETLKTTQSYKKIAGIYDQRITFQIPVFKENTLPKEVSVHPKNTNPNNYLSDLKINDKTVENFNPEVFEYNYTVNKSVNSINITATTISNTATVQTGNYPLTDETKQTLKVNVTAQNGAIRTYQININKIEEGIIIKPITEILNNASVKFNESYISGISVGTDISKLTNNITNYASANNTNIIVNYKDHQGNPKTNGSFKTGDVISINNGEKEYRYEVVIKGDLDKDGEITILDLLAMKKMILKSISSTTLENRAGDIDLDNNVTILDLLELKKDILNSKKIVQ